MEIQDSGGPYVIDIGDTSHNNVVLKGDCSRISLRYRDLRGADLSKTTGLMSWALAGSDLRGARLPEGFKFDLLDRAEESAKLCRNSFFALLTAAFLCWLVRISLNDAEFLLARTGAQIPLIDQTVNIKLFYFLTPFLILLMYYYFHLGLNKFMEAVVNLPSYFPDGLRIDKKLYPWPLGRVSELLFPNLRKHASPFSKARVISTVILFWFAAPASLVAYWLHYLNQHEVWLSIWHVVLIGLALGIELGFANRLHRIIFHSRFHASSQSDEVDLEYDQIIPRLPRMSSHPRSRSNLGEGEGQGGEEGQSEREDWSEQKVFESKRKQKNRLHIGLMALLILCTLFYTTTVCRGWMQWPDDIAILQVEDQVLDGMILNGRNLKGIHAKGASFSAAKLIGCDFSNADLQECDFQGAILEGCNFRNANIRGANFQGCNLANADLQGANFQGANLVNADLRGIDMKDADFRGANLEGAIWGDP